jgi:hypothetical protein
VTFTFGGRTEVFTFGGRTEVFEARDAFYVPPGHLQSAEANSEYLQFSPAEELAKVSAVMQPNMEAMQEA